MHPLPWPRVQERFTNEVGLGYGGSGEGGAGSKGEAGHALPGGDSRRLGVLGGLCSEQKETTGCGSKGRKQAELKILEHSPRLHGNQGRRPGGEGRASVLGSLSGQRIYALAPHT